MPSMLLAFCFFFFFFFFFFFVFIPVSADRNDDLPDRSSSLLSISFLFPFSFPTLDLPV